MTELLTGTSVLFLPWVVGRVVLGILVCVRKPGFRHFAGDVQIGQEFAARAAVLIDNAGATAASAADRGWGLFCEVHHNSPALLTPPKTGTEDQNGQGLQVVSRVAARWGARRTSAGKVVRCELPVYAGSGAAQNPGGEPMASASSIAQRFGKT